MTGSTDSLHIHFVQEEIKGRSGSESNKSSPSRSPPVIALPPPPPSPSSFPLSSLPLSGVPAATNPCYNGTAEEEEEKKRLPSLSVNERSETQSMSSQYTESLSEFVPPLTPLDVLDVTPPIEPVTADITTPVFTTGVHVSRAEFVPPLTPLDVLGVTPPIEPVAPDITTPVFTTGVHVSRAEFQDHVRRLDDNNQKLFKERFKVH